MKNILGEGGGARGSGPALNSLSLSKLEWCCCHCHWMSITLPRGSRGAFAHQPRALSLWRPLLPARRQASPTATKSWQRPQATIWRTRQQPGNHLADTAITICWKLPAGCQGPPAVGQVPQVQASPTRRPACCPPTKKRCCAGESITIAVNQPMPGEFTGQLNKRYIYI